MIRSWPVARPATTDCNIHALAPSLCSGGSAFITMVETANLGNRYDAACFRWLHRSRLRCVFLQPQMCAGLMIVGCERLQVLMQAAFIKDNYVIEALATDRSNHAFNIGSLPRRSRRRQYLLDSHCLHLFNKFMPEDPIPIPQQILRGGVPGKCLAQLVSRPFGSRMRCDPEVNDSPALVSQNENHVQNLKPDGRDREEVYRYQTLTMILKKSSPRLRGRLPRPNEVFAHTALADVYAEFQQFTMNARRTPSWIVTAHPPNQVARIPRYRGTSSLPSPDLPCPEHAERLAVPCDYGFRLDDNQRGSPAPPDARQADPDQTVRRMQSRTLH